MIAVVLGDRASDSSGNSNSRTGRSRLGVSTTLLARVMEIIVALRNRAEPGHPKRALPHTDRDGFAVKEESSGEISSGAQIEPCLEIERLGLTAGPPGSHNHGVPESAKVLRHNDCLM